MKALTGNTRLCLSLLGVVLLCYHCCIAILLHSTIICDACGCFQNVHPHNCENNVSRLHNKQSSDDASLMAARRTTFIVRKTQTHEQTRLRRSTAETKNHPGPLVANRCSDARHVFGVSMSQCPRTIPITADLRWSKCAGEHVNRQSVSGCGRAGEGRNSMNTTWRNERQTDTGSAMREKQWINKC